MAEKKADKCAHPGCNCPAAKGSKYCSPYCARAGKEFSIALQLRWGVCCWGNGECSALNLVSGKH
jgi:hypothetical protein